MSKRPLLLTPSLVVLLTLAIASTTEANRPGGRELADARRIAAGSAHTCTVRDDGRVQCWGWNAFGQVGDGTTNDRTGSGVFVVGLSPRTSRPADALAVAAGAIHTCAVRFDTVACWGENGAGQLGDGTRATRTSAVHLLISGAMGLALGIDHTCALLETGRVRCWGDNASGQLGTGTNDAQIRATTAVDVTGLNDAVAIAAGLFHTCAIRSTGRLLCWGGNESGQLGNNTTTNRNTPQQIANLENVIDVVAGAAHTCALLANGRVRCWGNNLEGELGNLSFDSSLVPVQVSSLENVKALSAGWSHTCAVRADATTHCWGDNSSGQLGDGTQRNRPFPVPVAALGANVVTVAAGNGHTCVLHVNGTMSCWGFNELGPLGGAPLGQVSGATSVRFVTARSPALTLDGGREHTCAVRATGAVACWGLNQFGSITGAAGVSGQMSNPTGPAAAVGIVSIAAGELHSCALTVSGRVLCWGSNAFGQIGNGQTSAGVSAPTTVPGLDQVVAVTAGGSFTCALRADGTVLCWGSGAFGEMGDGTGDSSASPTPVSGLGNVAAIAAGTVHACAVQAAGGVRCWGAGLSGQLGNGQSETVNPNWVAVSDLVDARAVSAGESHTCAIRATGGGIVCWGSNLFGQLGTGEDTSSLVPVPISARVVVSVTFENGGQFVIFTVGQPVTARDIGLGRNHSCIVSGSGPRTVCWGDNSLSQIGIRSLTDTTTYRIPATVQRPADEPEGRGRTLVSPEGDRTCALRPDGTPFCWGDVVGTGLTTTPVEIPSFRVNVAPQAAFAGQSSTVTLRVTANCLADQHLEIEVQLEQASAAGAGRHAGPCEGGVEEYPVTVPARGKPGFVAGPATATATVVIRDNGRVVNTQTWRRIVTIAP